MIHSSCKHPKHTILHIYPTKPQVSYFQTKFFFFFYKIYKERHENIPDRLKPEVFLESLLPLQSDNRGEGKGVVAFWMMNGYLSLF